MSRIILLILGLIVFGMGDASAQKTPRIPVERLLVMQPKQQKTLPASNRAPLAKSLFAKNDIAPGCDSVYLDNQTDIDNFATAHPDCDTLRMLIINGAGITNLNGLSNVVAVTENLIISNTSLGNLSGLSAITYIGGTLQVDHDHSISSLGLNNLAQLGRLRLTDLPALNSLAGLSNNLSTTGSIVIDSVGLTSLTGLENIATITEFDGLSVGHSNISNLNGITNLASVGGYIRLESNPNLTSIGLTNLQSVFGFLFATLPNLTHVNGLTDHLTNTSIGTFWFINTGISDLSGMSHMTSASNFYLWINPNLTSLNGLQGLSGNIGGGISLWNNSSLTDISALGGVTSIDDGTLEFNQHPLLSDLTGIGNITHIGGGLWVTNNDAINTLNYLNSSLSIDNNNNDQLKIQNNPLLSFCSSSAICNYLASARPFLIENNAPGCADVNEVTAACSACSGGVLKTWSGNEDDQWSNPNNWLPAGVPGTCDTVLIPEGMFNYPVVNSNITIHGLTMESSTQMQLQDYSLTSRGVLVMNNAQINSSRNNNNITFIGADNGLIESSYLEATNVSVLGSKGTLQINNNNIDGNLSISDSANHPLEGHTGGNHITGDFTFTANANDGQMSVAEYSDDEIEGSVIFNIIGQSYLLVGPNGYSVRVGQNFTLNSDIDPNYINLFNVVFIGGTWGHIIQQGTVPITFGRLSMEKYVGAQTILDQPVYVKNELHPYTGLLKTTATNLLIMTPLSYVSQFSSSSWVSGPMKKIGNEQFTFPIGDDNYQGVLTILSPPNQTDAYTAQYFHANPSLFGYNPNQKDGSLSRISTKEFWTIQKDPGSSDVGVSLIYDSTRSDKTGSIYSLRTSQWNGSIWENKGAIFLSGNLASASLTTSSSVTNYTLPLTLGYIEPPIIPKITITKMDSFACRNSNLRISFTVDTLMFSGNDFQVQLSDSAGSFATPTLLGTLTDKTNSDSIDVFISPSLKLSELYRVRIIGNSPPDTSINTPGLAIRAVPSAAFTIKGPQPGCMGSVNKYYVSQKQAGVTYTWSLSGGGTMTTNQDTAYVTWTSSNSFNLSVTVSNSCGIGGTVTQSITVGYPAPVATPTLNKTGRWLYASNPDANQHASGFHWYKNDVLIVGANASSYYANEAGSYKVTYFNPCGDGPASTTTVFAVNSSSQTISFPAVSNKTYGDSAFAIPVTASSGFPVSLAIVSGPGNLTGNTYTITNSGTVTILATQPGDDVYDTAAFVYVTFTVNKAAQTISFTPPAETTVIPSTINLAASSNSGLPVLVSVQSGPASLLGSQLTATAPGLVTLKAVQTGDTNYLPAADVTRTICVRAGKLGSLNGPIYVCPGQTATYKTAKYPDLVYRWRLTDGTNYGSVVDSAQITWNTPGTYTLLVSATGPCGMESANDTLVVNVITPVTPGVVSNMLPANGSAGLSLPLTLSWIPGNNALTYDLYIWDSASVQPGIPFATNITGVSYAVIAGQLSYNTTYNWRVVSRNACLSADGPVQKFRLRPLPDLIVSNIQIPSSAISGQTVNFSWRVTNNGPGNTLTNQSWYDAVFLSFDTIPHFNIPPNTNPAAWGVLDFPVRPLLVGTKPNVTALDSGQHYDNSISFTLPPSYAQPLYLYVITNFPVTAYTPMQMNYTNDTARSPQAMNVTLAPTPDLRVDTILAPASVFSGSTVNITYKVKNFGVLTPAASSWTDKIYISQSPVFNINTATLLKLPKANGTYYDDADDAQFNFSGQLLQDSSYTRSVQAVIPNFISGNYFVYVVTNTGNSLFEGVLSGNNVTRTGLQVFLTPTPTLTVSNIQLPVTTASTTQPLGLNWVILNTGFNNNLEKNKGHYYLPNGTCVNGLVRLTDSVGYGSSYWIDRIYLSTDSTGINGTAIQIGEFAHGTQNSGQSADFAPAEKCVTAGTNPATQNINTDPVITPGSSHPGNLTFNVPDNLPQGNYFVYVVANATKTVFEYPGATQIRRSVLPISIQRPDLAVSAVTVPSNATGGQPITIQWNVVNNGPGSVFNHIRKDKIYLSSSATFNELTAQLLSTQVFTENIAAGGTVSHSLAYTPPAALSGTWYVYVQTNFDSSIREQSYVNNIGSGNMLVTAAIPADLLINTFTVPDTVTTLFASTIKYAVQNTGAGNANGNWTDSLFVSCNATFNYNSAYMIETRAQTRQLATNDSYTDSFNLNLPVSWYINNCFPQTLNSTAYFFVRTNGGNVIYESGNTGNNQAASGARILRNPLVDHIVTHFTVPDTITVGRPYTTNWTVKNIGFNPGQAYYYSWRDAVYYSTDSILDATDITGNTFNEDFRLGNGQTYSDSKQSITPKLATGDYYLLMVSNMLNEISLEKNISNNAQLLRDANGNAKPVHVIQPLLPDLADSFLVAPNTVASGQLLTATHRITNKGIGASYPGRWVNELWLSQDFVPGNTGDILLSSKNINANLQSAEYIDDTLSVVLNLSTPAGNYVLISRTDAANAVIEEADSNNLAFTYLNIFNPAPADLTVQNVVKPDTAWMGYPMSPLQWTVSNQSPNAANGISSDGVYLSKNNFLDSTAQLQGVLNKVINMAPLSSSNISLSPLVNASSEGQYYLLVKTDLLNNIYESNKDNNTGAAASKVVVKAREIKIGIPELNTLQNVARIYKISIPDSLAGATIGVTLNTDDSLTLRNELFIAQGYVPGPASYDYKYETPNFGNQRIVMTSVVQGDYYVYIRTVSPNPPVQNITVSAVKLPFAILTVQSNNGGNAGNVTVKITGSLFVPGMIARLSNGSGQIIAQSMYYINSTSVYATFNLKGKALGVYDILLKKPDSAETSLAAAFSVVNADNGGLGNGFVNNGPSGSGNEPGCDPGAEAGLNSLLVTEVIIPKKIFAGWPFAIQINFANPTNMDLPAQVRILYNDLGIPVAFTQADLPTGTASIYLNLTEPGGPPGIIRAGASGSIILYGKAPQNTPGHSFVKFILK